MFLLIIFAVILSLLVWFGYLKPYSYWTKLGVKQIKPWFLVGNSGPALFRTMNVKEWMDWIYYYHPGSRYSGLYNFLTPSLVIKDPELIKQLTVKDFEYFTDHSSVSVSEDDVLWSKNLFALKGQRWKEMRSLLSGSFTSSKIKQIYSLISEASENFANHFLSKNEDLVEVEMKDIFTRYTSDVIASTSFGISVDSLKYPENEFYLMGKEATNFGGFVKMLKGLLMVIFPRLAKIFKIEVFNQKISSFFTSTIMDTIKTREEQGIVRPDMINILLEAKNGVTKNDDKDDMETGFAVVKEHQELGKSQKRHIEITDMDITSQAMIFFLAGFDTVATTLCYTCYELAANPEIQDKLRDEIKEALRLVEGHLPYEALVKMKYLDMVISESLRKWPVAIVSDRVCVKPYVLQPTATDEPTLSFQKNDLIWIPTISIHNDPKYYPIPEKFDPERFSSDNKDKIVPYTYMPFGVGPRACIGSRFGLLEMKSILCHLLDKFEIVPVEKTKIPIKLSRKTFSMVPDGGFPVGLRRIQK